MVFWWWMSFSGARDLGYPALFQPFFCEAWDLMPARCFISVKSIDVVDDGLLIMIHHREVLAAIMMGMAAFLITIRSSYLPHMTPIRDWQMVLHGLYGR